MMVCDKTYYFVYIDQVYCTIISLMIIIVVGNENTQEQVDIRMKRNVAYEAPPSRMKMTENRAYNTLPIAYK